MTLLIRVAGDKTGEMTIVGKVHDRILVGVDASAASRAAVLVAAREARLRRCELIITHVDPVPVRGSVRHGPVAATDQAATVDCGRLLANSAEAASFHQPGVAVGTLLLRGTISDELIALSRSAVLLVLGVDHSGRRAAHGVIGSVEDRVLVHSACPVMLVHPTSDGFESRLVSSTAGCLT